jgi:hypothetical protein
MQARPLLLLLLAGCASAGTESVSTPSTTTISMGASNPSSGGVTTASEELQTYADAGITPYVVNGTPEVVLPLVEAVYVELGIPVLTRDVASRTIGNRNFRAVRRLGAQQLSTYFRCGQSGVGTELANDYRLTVSALTSAKAVAQGTELRTAVSAQASAMATSGAPVPCTSNGQLEQAIARGVQARIAGQGAVEVVRPPARP